jgi:hypothetical protein
MNCLVTPTQQTGEPEAHARAGISERFRRLKWNEVVWSGDFVADELLGFELWEAPGVFRAGSFSSPLPCSTSSGAFLQSAVVTDFARPVYRKEKTDRPQPENQNKTQNIAMKTPKITARSRYHKQSAQLH